MRWSDVRAGDCFKVTGQNDSETEGSLYLVVAVHLGHTPWGSPLLTINALMSDGRMETWADEPQRHFYADDLIARGAEP